MSHIRQIVQNEPEGLLVRTLGLRLSNNHVIEGHNHSWGQIIFALRGVMQVDADGNRWVVPPMRCLWVPPEIDHTILFISETWMRTIYVCPDLGNSLSINCKVLNVSPLLRELILETVQLKMLSQSVTTHRHLAAVLIDQLVAADEMLIKVTMPTDPRAVRLADLISSDPANKSPLRKIVKMTGGSPRTLERLFIRETGISVGRWRKQARLMMAIRLLVEGRSVNQAAFESGYESPSAFVSMFRRETGTTPRQYFRVSASDTLS